MRLYLNFFTSMPKQQAEDIVSLVLNENEMVERYYSDAAILLTNLFRWLNFRTKKVMPRGSPLYSVNVESVLQKLEREALMRYLVDHMRGNYLRYFDDKCSRWTG